MRNVEREASRSGTVGGRGVAIGALAGAATASGPAGDGASVTAAGATLVCCAPTRRSGASLAQTTGLQQLGAPTCSSFPSCVQQDSPPQKPRATITGAKPRRATTVRKAAIERINTARNR